MHVFAFDPGQTCGWALLWVPKDKPTLLRAAGECIGTAAGLMVVWQAVGDLADLVVCEDWYRNDTSVDARDALHPTGMLLMLAHQQHTPVKMQQPKFRLSISDDKLGLGDYWMPNLKPHDDRRQAIRHGLAFIVHTQHHLPTTKALHPRDHMQ